MDVFLSYAHEDREEANEICSRLDAAGISCFMAAKMSVGQLFDETIRRQLVDCRELVILVSEHVCKSEWVTSEWSGAWVLGKPITPILLRIRSAELPERLRRWQAAHYHELDRIIAGFRQRQQEADREQREIQDIASRVAGIVSRRLENQDSVFSVRSGHYREEKLALARGVADLLEQRVRHLLATGVGGIRIIFDSGSTISPIFDELAQRAADRDGYWLNRADSRVEILTNNIRGLSSLLQHRERRAGSRGPEGDRYAEVPFPCTVLPGRILAVYQAIASEETVKALVWLRQGPEYVISVLTGNYVASAGQPVGLMPVARSGFHPAVKTVLYSIADEVLVVAPLGKVLRDACGVAGTVQRLVDRLNSDLGYRENATVPSQRPYLLIDTALIDGYLAEQDHMAERRRHGHSDWVRKEILVTTEREPTQHLFYQHYRALREGLCRFDPSGEPPYPSRGPYLWGARFRDLPVTREQQVRAEVPHENLRKKDLIERYFGLEPPVFVES